MTYESFNQQYFAELCWAKLLNMCTVTSDTMCAFIADHSQNLFYGNLIEYLNPALFTTMANKEDCPTYAKALYDPYSSGFTSTMETEILVLIELKVFDVIEIDPHMKLILVYGHFVANDIQTD